MGLKNEQKKYKVLVHKYTVPLAFIPLSNSLMSD